MYALVGLHRDPYAPVCDGPLFWESPARKDARRAARELLLAGTGVWLSGPRGSGRASVLARLAEETAQGGRRVLWTEPAESPSPEELLARLLEVVSGQPPPADLLGSAEALYARILEVFCAGGPVLCFPGLDAPTVGSLAEAAILARFRVAGRPLVVLALAGEGDPPFSGLEKVSLPAPTAGDLEACLRHRAAACGNGDALSPDAFREVAASAGGFGEAVAKARLALARAAFLSGPPEARRFPAYEPPGERGTVLDAGLLEELGGLLDSLGPGR